MRGVAASVGVMLILGAACAFAQLEPPSFDELDTDQSSTLTPEEIAELVFVRWDANGDGAVTREEFDARVEPDRGADPPDDDSVPHRAPRWF